MRIHVYFPIIYLYFVHDVDSFFFFSLTCDSLLMHLLKWQYQPERQSRSWAFTIKEQRLRIGTLMRKNPSLQSQVPEALKEGYWYATFAAAEETRLDRATFSAECPWTFEKIMDEQFWPQPEIPTAQ